MIFLKKVTRRGENGGGSRTSALACRSRSEGMNRRRAIASVVLCCFGVRALRQQCLQPEAGARHVVVSDSTDGLCNVTDYHFSQAGENEHAELCWNVVNMTEPAPLPPNTPQSSFEPSCDLGAGAPVIVIGVPATIRHSEPSAVFQNCDLFSRKILERGGIPVDSVRHFIQCVAIGDSEDERFVTNVVSRLAGDWHADAVLAPTSTELTYYAALQSVVDNRTMIVSTSSSDRIFEEANAVAMIKDRAPNPMVYGLLPPVENYLTRSFDAICYAARTCDESSGGCDFEDRCLEHGAPSCTEALRLGVIRDEEGSSVLDSPSGMCSNASALWAASSCADANDALTNIWNEGNLTAALTEMQANAVTVVIICGAETFAIAAVEAMESLGFAPLAAIVTNALAETEYAGRVLDEGWWEGEYFIQPVPWHRSLPGEPGNFSNMTSEDYADEYYKVFGTEPDYVGAATYAGLCAFAVAVREAGTLSVYDVTAAMRNISLMEFYDPIRFGDNGRMAAADFPVVQYPPETALERSIEREMSLAQLQGGLKVVDYPASAERGNDAIHNVSFPMPTWAFRRCVYESALAAAQAGEGSEQCSGRGTCSEDGTCACEEPYSTSAEYAHANCALSCSGHGEWVNETCECDSLYSGEHCEEECNGRGAVDVNTGECICEDGYTGDDCADTKQFPVEVLIISLMGFLVCAVLVLLWMLRRRRLLQAALQQAEQEYARWESATRRSMKLSSALTGPSGICRRCRQGEADAREKLSARARVVAAPGVPDQMYHAFVSHAWATAQDQARSLKELLQNFVQNIVCFLDVDNLEDISRLDEYIENSSAILIFLSGSTRGEDGTQQSDYFSSANCMVELRAAVRLGKPIILVLETNPSHGGVPLDVHRRACPEELASVVFAAPTIPWHRLRDFQICTMRLLVVELLRAWQIPGADRPVFIPREKLRQPLPRLQTKKAFHLSHSDNNPGAAEIVAKMEAAVLVKLRVTRIAKATPENCLRFLIYLNDSTFSPGPRADALAQEIEGALASELPLLLVHEQRSGLGALTFADIMEATPEPLREAGIYQKIAAPIYDGPHEEVSVRLLLDEVERSAIRSNSYLQRALSNLSSRMGSPSPRVEPGDGELAEAVVSRQSSTESKTIGSGNGFGGSGSGASKGGESPGRPDKVLANLL